MPDFPLFRRLVFSLIGSYGALAVTPAPAAEGTEPGVICPVEAIAGSHSWSPDSRGVVFVAPDRQIKILSARFGTANAMTTEVITGHPVWSPTGERIAVLHSESENADLPYATLYMWDGTGATQLSALAGGLSTRLPPVWSPDGRQVLALTVDGDLVTVDARTGVKKLIHEPKSKSAGIEGRPAWLSNTEVVYQAGAGTLFIADIDTGASTRLKGSGLYTGLEPQANGDIWTSRVEDEKGQLTLLSGGKVIRAIDAPVNGFSGPNRQGKIAVQFQPAGGLRLIDIATGVASVLTQNPGDSDPAMAPDGGAVSFTRRDASGESMHLCIAALP